MLSASVLAAALTAAMDAAVVVFISCGFHSKICFLVIANADLESDLV